MSVPAIVQIDSPASVLILQADFPQFTPEELFDYFTQAELLKCWWPQHAITEPRIGGKYQLSWPDMNWDLTGEFTVFEPGRRLAFTWQWQHEQEKPVRQVDLTFEPLDGGSRLVLRHGNYQDNESDQADRRGHLEGWTYFLKQLQELSKGAC
jgi:uncharacterized protein YndB with AHSA1/START domain